MAKTIKITQTRSAIGRLPKHKATLLGLGLRRIGHTVEREDTPAAWATALCVTLCVCNHLLLFLLHGVGFQPA